jgi:hypothetical protein
MIEAEKMNRIAKAAVMTAAGQDLAIKEYPLPAVAPGCILVKVTFCTICGSDVHSWMGRRQAGKPGGEEAGRLGGEDARTYAKPAILLLPSFRASKLSSRKSFLRITNNQ